MRVAVIGTGLVGGSIGLALAGLGHELVGYDRDADRLARATGLRALVALVVQVPQRASWPLMDVATAREAEHRALLRLAAGGSRDMTRIAASHPAIWLDILTSNRDAILTALDAYLEALGAARKLVAS